MSNPFNAINPANPYNANAMSGMRGAYQLLTQSRNPMQTFQQLAQQNPALQPILTMLNQGANPQQLFMSLCQQRGINPQEFLKNITGR